MKHQAADLVTLCLSTSPPETVKIQGVGDLSVRRSSDGRSDHVQATNLRVKLDIGQTRHQINYEANSERDRVIGEAGEAVR